MVVMSIQSYENLASDIETKLDEGMEIRRILYSRRHEETLLD